MPQSQAKAKHPGGRPTLLTPAAHAKIVNLVRAGNFPETAAAVAGIARPTLRSWLKEAAILRRQQEETPRPKLNAKQALLLKFLTELDAAMGEAEARDVLAIGKLAEKDWRAAAWRLERRNRQLWGVVPRQCLDNDPDNPEQGDEASPSEIAIVYDGPPPPPVKQ